MANFAEGKFANQTLDIRDKSELAWKRAGWFIALQLFLNGGGIRRDVVRNLTVGNVRHATRVPDECPYCLEKVDFEEHKETCLDRARSHTDMDIVRKTKRYTLTVTHHKTKDQAPIHIVVTSQELRAIRSWLGQDVSKLEEDHRPFEKLARWDQLRTTLAKLVDPELMQRAMGTDGKSLLISKSFRRYHVQLILKEGREVNNRLRAIGHDVKTAVTRYDGETTRRFLRAEDAKKRDGDSSTSSDSDDYSLE